MDAFEALADPTRRKIVVMLAARERNAGEIASKFDMTGPSVSRHLRVLRQSRLISYRSEAQSRIYRLDDAKLDQVKQWMQTQIDLYRERFDRLGMHLDKMKERERGHARGRTRALRRSEHDRVRSRLLTSNLARVARHYRPSGNLGMVLDGQVRSQRRRRLRVWRRP
jgi:DNA-binding transcriptional ArsR family regulator